MADVPTPLYLARQQVLGRVTDVLGSHGYVPIETPIIEPTEIFLRKSGGERVAQMYAFNYRDREIALRPEHTASILRMYVESMQSEPLPIRLMYAGPVFRYEKPQAGRTRQFTEVGCELLGAAGASADTEVIHLALEGLRVVDVPARLVLGHVGIVLDYLNRLPLRQRARDWLLWSMDRIRTGQPVDLEADIAGLVGHSRLTGLLGEMGAGLHDLPADQLEQWFLAVLQEVGVQMQGQTRDAREIVAGVIAKMSRGGDEVAVRHAFDFIREMATIRGAPAVVLPELRRIVERYNLSPEPIEQIEDILNLLGAYGHLEEDIELNPGLGRGLHYYTGMLFEIYAADRPTLQLCGGGRYDDLAYLLGARRAVPACGFSYGLERLVEAARPVGEPPAVEALVVAATPAATAAAIRVAEELRADGACIELDVRGRSLSANRRDAERRGITQLVIVDTEGRVTTQQLGPAAPAETPGRTTSPVRNI